MPVPEQKNFRETNELKWDNGHVMEYLHYVFTNSVYMDATHETIMKIYLCYILTCE